MNSSDPLLRLRSVSIRFGGLTAVSGVDFEIASREMVGLIGPNGAGKTTVFNLITGVYQPTEGEIEFYAQSLIGLKPNALTRLGIARTFQNIRLFPSLSVFDNVRVAMQVRNPHGMLSALWRGKSFCAGEKVVEKSVMELLSIFHLEGMRSDAATSLPYGAQRRLEIVRALATAPRLLLLDEPAAGMNPAEKEELKELIRFIHEKFEIGILLVEHDMDVVMGVCERIVVLEYGKMIAAGSPEEIRDHRAVIEAYLGNKVEDDWNEEVADA